MAFDQYTRSFAVGVTAAFVGDDVMLLGVRLEISGWAGVTLHANDISTGYVTVECLPDELADICEYEMTDGSLRIAGFTRHAHGYADLMFQTPQVTVEYHTQQKIQRLDHPP
ncbi:hypothetical protein GCM10008960_02790 [Deinococcus sedimenti]|uniref:Uncharacterized protein n=2 Tax=Deinococcus sedimenti TaxID=1867090 RepID=A0ABQ2S1D2_9DEIO|nr:hypothetical protein GCM10008960_02790 [Deinococcus sedimenti]